MTKNITSHSPEETLAVAAALAEALLPGDVVALFGDLGSGKTVFASGVAKSLGIHTPISSPTYTIQHTYHRPEGQIHHIDLYRLATPDDVDMLDLATCWDNDAITLVEWAERAGNLLPPQTWRISIFAACQPDERHITICPPAQRD
jgi:tRNA threonylcarbamoyladenosine biosynthesis protein TsaE